MKGASGDRGDRPSGKQDHGRRGGCPDGRRKAPRTGAALPGSEWPPARRKRGGRPGRGPLYGALDLGTNNCRLLIARPTRRGFLVVDSFSRIIRLGEGLGQCGALSDAAMARTIAALKVCADKMAKQGVVRSRLIATEACRRAANGSLFLERVRRETGLELEVVSRETEARLAVSGCASLLDARSDWALVFDIGGGSSELIWLDLSRFGDCAKRSLERRLEVQRCIAAWTSIPIGVITLAERYGGRQVSEEVFAAMVDTVLGHLRRFECEHGIALQTMNARTHLLGTSGTVTTIAGVHLGLKHYDRRRVDGCWLSTRRVREIAARLVAMSYEERVAQPCIGVERAEMVLAGCAILEALLRMWPSERLRVADRGLREGILATLIAEDALRAKKAKNANTARARAGGSGGGAPSAVVEPDPWP